MYKGKTVLIVDDSPVERHILKGISKGLGFEIVEADSGENGIKRAEEHRPDLILMDVVMPGMNGFQATRQINQNEELKHIPIIMCTSKSALTDKVWGQRQGAKAYIVKPINPDELIAEIKKLLG